MDFMDENHAGKFKEERRGLYMKLLEVGDMYKRLNQNK